MHIAEVELARRERASRRTPVTFDFGGQTFTLLPVVPIGLGFDLMDAPEPEDNEAAAVRAIARFVRESLIDDDQPRFDEVLRNRSDPIDPEAIIDLGAHVTEVYTGFPSVPSGGSAGGRRNGGRSTRPAGRGKAT